MIRPGRLAALISGLLVLPGTAEAHLVTSGLGPFYDGSLHLLLSPVDLLGIIALSLLAGLRGPRAARQTVISLTLSWLFAGMIGSGLANTFELAWLNVLSFTLLGGLVVIDARLPPIVMASIGGLYGTLHGLHDGSTLVTLGADAISLLGIVLTVLLLALLTSAAVVPLERLWARLAVRIMGSWVVAVGILMLGWLARGVV